MRRCLFEVMLVLALMPAPTAVRAANIVVDEPTRPAPALSLPSPEAKQKYSGFGPQRPSFMDDTPPPKTAAPAPVAPPPVAPAAALPKIRFTGMIDPGDADKLRAVFARLQSANPKADPLAIIEMSSMGGSLTEGFLIGALLRQYKVIAVVRRQDFCMSSCALAFLAGNVFRRPPAKYPAECNIEIGGKVAFHNFFLNRNGLREATTDDPVASRLQGFADARGGAALLIKYAGDIGLQPNFVASMMGRPVEDFQYIETIGQFLSLHVCPIGLDRPKTAMEVQAANVCANSLGPDSESGTQPVLQARLMKREDVKLTLLERVQAYMQSSKAKGRLAAQLSSGSVMRVREEIERLYEDLRAAGVALPEIVGPTYEVGRDVQGERQIACYVSVNPDDPDDYDVVVQGPRGLAEPSRAPPENSRRLFLYDTKDVVNPKPH
ncbi:MAG: hypothetical protein JOY81_11970 [Alphaproteobacteria bacterium]|nr:hypothetical protein [Alphaproteobacteria bacterium]